MKASLFIGLFFMVGMSKAAFASNHDQDFSTILYNRHYTGNLKTSSGIKRGPFTYVAVAKVHIYAG